MKKIPPPHLPPPPQSPNTLHPTAISNGCKPNRRVTETSRRGTGHPCPSLAIRAVTLGCRENIGVIPYFSPASGLVLSLVRQLLPSRKNWQRLFAHKLRHLN